MRVLKIMITCLLLSISGYAQQASDSEVEALGYNPTEIVNEWYAWKTESTNQNKFIGSFMNEYDVPQEGLHGLSLKDTWYWWISHHAEAARAYLALKEENNTN